MRKEYILVGRNRGSKKKFIIGILLYIYTGKGRLWMKHAPPGRCLLTTGRGLWSAASACMVAGGVFIDQSSGVAGGDACDVELRRVALLRPGGGLLLRRLVEERPAAPRPPVAAPAGAVSCRVVVVSGSAAREEAVHTDRRRRRLLRAPERALLPLHATSVTVRTSGL